MVRRAPGAGLVVVALTIALAACSRPGPAPDSASSPGGPGPAKTKPGAFSRQRLLEDARELAAIIENTHPEPYLNGGGRMAFHRRLHRVLNAIPDEGMTREEFYRLLRPFVAGVGDAHTNLLHGYALDFRRPGGIPLRFRVVEESLVVSGAEAARRNLLGSRLVSVERVPVAQLAIRQRRLEGIDNQYHALHVLATRSLVHRAHMRDVLPEWQDPGSVRVELQRPDGRPVTLRMMVPDRAPAWVTPPSRVDLPVPGDEGFTHAFLRPPGGGQEVAYVRFTHMGGYREAQEQQHPFVTSIRRPASATESFRRLVVEMKRRRTGTLVLDVRDNPGGNSLISEILVYYLYGREKLLEMAGVTTGEHGAFRYSRLYFADRPSESLASINRGRAVPLVEGDYDFAWSFEDGRPIARRSGDPGDPPMVRFLRVSPTFRREYDASTYSGHYLPGRVFVLCSAGTLSAGFSVVVEFWRLGATTVGTPPAQAPNSYGSGTFWTLRHTGLRGMVPMVGAAHFPDDPSRAHVLPVDDPLTYERLASYGFDPNAEYLQALARR